MQKLIVIVGPTASGKTDLAFVLAKKFNGYIICADSRTIYQEMNIGTAKPSVSRITNEYTTNDSHIQIITKEQALASPPLKGGVSAGSADRVVMSQRGQGGLYINTIPHYGLDLIPPTESFSAAQFKEYAENIIDGTIPYSIPFLVGGTGLYISAVVDNLSFPDAPPNETFRNEKETLSLNILVSELLEKNPDAQDSVDLKNKRRVIRALECIEHTGTVFSQHYTQCPQKYNILMLGVKRNREELYNRINKRVDDIMKQGFLEEFELLYQKYGCSVPGMTGIGYRQFCLWKHGELSLEQAIEKFKQGDRNLAKRQLTWFKRDKRIHWIQSPKEATDLIDSWL